MKTCLPVRTLMTALLLVAASHPVAPALAADPARGREVIVLVHEAFDEALRGESIYTAMETVLNHQGLIARYHDVAAGLPDAALSARARGVVVLVEGPAAADPVALAHWLAGRIDAGQPVALLSGDAVIREHPDGRVVDPEAADGVFARLGVQEIPLPAGSAIAEGPHAPFEAPWSSGVPATAFEAVTTAGPGPEGFWALRGSPGRALGFVGDRGAVTTGLDAIRESNSLTYRLRWRVDPFWLVDRLFRTASEPALDTTTLNGRRIFYAHVDGDGFANRAVRRDGPIAAIVVRDEVLGRTWLPTTISVIANEIAGKPEREAIARSIFRLPHVAAASHSYHHPHDWAKGTLTAGGGDGAGADVKAVAVRLDPKVEVDAAAAYINTLLPAGKRVGVMLWSGQTNPTSAYLARTEALGLANLNGGDATLDRRHPSLANLAPLARQVGPYLQVYASAGNENVFTNLWTGPFDGQAQAIDLYRFAGAPRRVAPVNIYYHFYAAERSAGLKALHSLYRWAEAQPLAHLTAERYCRVVEGFYQGRLALVSPGVWSVSNAGACRTLRFDHEARVPDWRASSGVAGYHRTAQSLYVHLSGPEARVALTDRPVSRPHLQEASAPLAAWSTQPTSIRATFEAAAPLTVVLAGFGRHQAVRVSGAVGPAMADAGGKLTLSAASGKRTLEVHW